jgi:hypothetical protein
MINKENNLEYIGTFGENDVEYNDLQSNKWLISLTVFPFYKSDGAFSPICLNTKGDIPFYNWDGSETEVKVN